MTSGGARGVGGRVSPVDYYREVVLPAVFADLPAAFAEFGFRRERGGWVAKGTGAKGETGPLGTRPDRVHCRMVRGEYPAGFGVHGGQPVPFCSWILGRDSGHPRGQEFLRAAAELARRVGVEPGPLGPGGAVADPAEMARVHERLEAQRREAQRLERRLRAERIAQARALWERSTPGHAGVAAYLAGRGIDLGALPGGAGAGLPRSLRFCPDVELGKKRLPAIVAAVVLPSGDGASVVAVHRIFVSEDGAGKNTKLRAAKMMLGPVAGGAVRLGNPGDGDTLILCEGIETGVALRAATGWPVWACLSANGLRSVNFPAAVARSVGRVVVAGDFDDPGVRDDKGHTPLRGQQAAVQAAERLADLYPGLEATVALPDGWAPEAWRQGTEAARDRGTEAGRHGGTEALRHEGVEA